MNLLDLKRKLISFVFQPTCCFCDEIIVRSDSNDVGSNEGNSIICDACYDEITGLSIDRCNFCGAITRTENPFGDRCRACRDWNSRFEKAISIGVYREKMKRTIIEIKRDCNDVKAHQLGQVLGNLSDKFDLPSKIDCVIPVPSHWRRRMSRKGFHVSDVIADGFCHVTGLKKSNDVLKCVRFTKKQAKLRPKQRIQNVRGAFVVNRKFPMPDIPIMLLDDVMTSGATINECTRVLLKAGATSVFVAVAARATGIS